MRSQLKKVLRFYFSAGSLNSALDGVITYLAASSWQEKLSVESVFERVNTVIAVKRQLRAYWARLDGVMVKLPQADLQSLKRYAALRTGVTVLDKEEQRRIHSALVKFRRRAGAAVSTGAGAYKCICAYYALISSVSD